MGKPPRIKTIVQWAGYFTATLDSKCSDCDEVHLVLDRYDLSTSLKEATRHRRQVGKPATAYHVTDNTPIRCQQSSSCPVPQPKMNWQFIWQRKLYTTLRVSPRTSSWLHGKRPFRTLWMFSISAAPKKKLTQGLSYTVWMLLEEEQQNSTFSHLTLMSLSLQFTVTFISAGTLTSSLVWGTRSC